MLRIYSVILDWIAEMSPVIRSIAGHDRHLADQLRRSATSVGLNTAEGMAATDRPAAYVCRDFTCDLPVHDASALADRLAGKA